MSVHSSSRRPPADFVGTVERLRAVPLRPEVTLEDLPSPQRIAPYSLALGAQVEIGGTEAATGRFVLLHDPSAPQSWEGTYRIVSYARAELEGELGSDPLLAQVGWSWLMDPVHAAALRYTQAGGTVTRVISETFGTLAERTDAVDLEIRASWTPLDDPAAHLGAWATALCTLAGLPPLPAGVSALRPRG